jgi:hypothetical protein
MAVSISSIDRHSGDPMADERILLRLAGSFLIRIRTFGIAGISLFAARLTTRRRDPKPADPDQDRAPPQL